MEDKTNNGEELPKPDLFSEEKPDPAAERDARCVPVALAIIKAIGEFDAHALTEQDKAKSFEAYNSLAQKAMGLILAADIPVGEANYVFQLVGQPREQITSILFESLNKHLADMQKVTFGCMIQEMKMSDLHTRLGGDKV